MTQIYGTPVAEVHIDAKLVRELLRDQHADLAESPLTHVDTGWDNAIYRLGDDLAVRIPRRELAVELIVKEQQHLPQLAATLPIPVPSPIRIGQPSSRFPWPWSVVQFLPGTTADLDWPNEDQAIRLADFLKSLHQPATAASPINELRTAPLAERAIRVEERIRRMEAQTEFVTDTIWNIWRDGLAAPLASKPRLIHGDLHARNVLVTGGAISGIIDWGDLTAGDVAIDLCGCWGLFESYHGRRQFLESYAPDDNEIARAKAWAVFYGVTLLETGLVDHLQQAKMGAATLRRLHDDFVG